jgi:hypothetical protein
MRKCLAKRFLITILICSSLTISGQIIDTNESKEGSLSNSNLRYYKKCTKQELKDDISFLKECLEVFHPSLYKYSSKGKVDSTMNDVRSSLVDSMSQSEFQFSVATCLASAHCWHTQLDINSEIFKDIESFGNYIPIKGVMVENNSVYVISSVDSMINFGDKIISINSIPVSDMLNKFYACLSADGYNKTVKTHSINKFFFYLYYTYIECTNQYDIQLIRNDSLINISVNGLKPKDFWDKYSKSNKENNAPIIYSKIDSGRIGWIKLNTFSSNTYAEYKIDYLDKFKNVFTSLRKDKTSNLIVDLRGCSGGSIEISMEFMTYLISKPFSYVLESSLKKNLPSKIEPYIKDGSFYDFPGSTRVDDSDIYSSTWSYVFSPKKKRFKGNIYFITDGGVTSASGMLMAILKNQKIGEIIGAETAGSFYTGSNGVKVKLPNSGVLVEISQSAGSVSLKNEVNNGFGVLPDYPVTTTFNDILQGKDAEINLIKMLIKDGAM